MEEIQKLTQQIQNNQNDAWAYLNRGICYKELCNMTSAQADFARAKKLGYNV